MAALAKSPPHIRRQSSRGFFLWNVGTEIQSLPGPDLQNVVNDFLLKFHEPELMGIETVVSESDLRNRDRSPDDVGESEADKGARLDGVRRRGVGGFPDTVEPQLKNVDEYGRIAGGATQRFEGEDNDDFFDDPFNQEPTLGSKLRISDEGVVIDFGGDNAVIFGGIAIAALLLYSLAK